MSMMTAALVTMAVITAGSKIAGGMASKKEAERNARMFEEQAGIQAGMIDEQKRIEGAQYDRARGRMRGKATARTAKAGLLLSGSPLAVMIDTETQMLMDRAIGRYNLDVQKVNVLNQSQATAFQYRQQGKAAERSGFTNAFTTLLTTGMTIGMMNMPSSNSATVNIMGKTQRVKVAPPNYYLRATGA